MFMYNTTTGDLILNTSDSISGNSNTNNSNKAAVEFEIKAEDYPYPIIMSSTDIKNMLQSQIKDYKIVCPDKVVIVYFSDNTSEKMVLHKGDTFDLRTCLYIAMAKHLYKKEYTLEGIEYKAKEFSMQKRYVKMVENVIKEHNRKENEEEKQRIREKEEAERIARKREKNRLRKQKKKERETQEYIKEQIYIQSIMAEDLINKFTKPVSEGV